MKELLTVTMDKPNVFNWIGAAIGGFIAWLMGLPPIYLALVVVQGADFLTGFLCAICGKSRKTASGGVASGPMFQGLVKKGLEWVAVGVIYVCGEGVGIPNIAGGAAAYVMTLELVSLMENMELFGLQIPIFQKILDVARGAAGEDKEK